ncbi:MAG: 50S ribosomal protein L20 [Candidatus Liptonbacteria bacterium]|nr:50S ribosomal protein L20 [Candidatus Liptonbacteria bacterium]
MPRVKRGTTANRKREKILKRTKGYSWGRKSKERAAKEALLHAEARMFRGRKEKKRVARTIWNVKINAAARSNGTTYSKLIDVLKKKNVELDRKILADLAKNHPEIFKKVLEALS